MKKLSLALFLLMPYLASFANPIDESTAKAIAFNFLSSKIRPNKLSTSRLTLAYKGVETVGNNPLTTCYYVFNLIGSKGFVIVSADDIVEPILGYSTESNYDTNVKRSVPIQLTEWLHVYSKRISNAIQLKKAATDVVKNHWKQLKSPNPIINNNPNKQNGILNGVSPLLQITWDQSPDWLTTGPYNKLCPFDKIYGARTVTGCVATAMAQVMKYWNYPATGTGSHSYTPASYPYLGVQSANFGNTTYQWDQMPNSLSATDSAVQINAVATLMYDCGVSVNMDYGVDQVGGSGSYSINYGGELQNTAQDALVNYFSYDRSLQGLQRSNYTESVWIGMLEQELNSSRPVIYTGSGNQGGHCFVADGYDNINFFHFNWGWSGYCNGYFNINDLSPSQDTFDLYQTAIIGIKPSILKVANTSDSLALVDLYNNTNGANWANNSGWLQGPVGSWFGVSLDTSGRVNTINLPNNNLTGNLPTSLGSLSKLTTLALGNNQLGGTIPLPLASINNLNADFTYNNYTFTGLEPIAKIIIANNNYNFNYIPQHSVTIQKTGNTLSVSVGAKSANILYSWYENGKYIQSIQGDSVFSPTSSGTYSVIAYDTTISYASLTSDTVTLSGITVNANISDSLALVDLYNSTNGANWTNNTGWLTSPVNSWYGIYLDTTGRVSLINLPTNNLFGTLPNTVGGLKSLLTFNVDNNHLIGSIPISINAQSSLNSIDVSNNYFTFSNLEPLTKMINGNNNIHFFNYYQDTIIPIHQLGNKLSVSVGGTSNSITYIWSVNGTIVTTIKGDSSYIPKLPGTYTVRAYDSLVSLSLNSTSDTVNVYIQPNTTDSLALVDLYNNTNGANWINKSGWLQSPLSSWYGVTLDTAGRVSILNLYNNNLVGTMPNSLGNLSDLTDLELISNQLSGSIPASLGNLTKLRYCFLESNSLSGNIPLSLRGLTYLYVSNNQFVFGDLEPIAKEYISDSLGNNISYSQQDTIIPINQVGNYLSVSVGGSPSQISYTWTLPGGASVIIHGDSTYRPTVSGYYSVTAYDSILKFSLSSSTFNATVYLSPNINDSLALVDLYNSTNGANWTNNTGWLQSPVSNWYGVVMDTTGRVTSLNLYFNNLTGSIPNSIGGLANLNNLNLFYNQLSGNIPIGLTSLTKLKLLDIRYNNYTFNGLEPVTNSFIADTSLTYNSTPQNSFPINQTGNKLWVSVGGTPSGISYYWSLNGAYLTTINGDSTFTPTLSGVYSVTAYDSIIGQTLYSKSDTASIYIQANSTDSLALVDLFNSTNGPKWLRHTYWLSKTPLSKWSGVTLDASGRVLELALGSDSLKGTIPPTLGNLSNIEILYLWGNQLSDTIPASLGNLGNVQILEIGQNQLTGSIPLSLGNLHNIDTLYLWGNKLTGSIPDTLGTLTNLKILSLSQNSLSGSIPTSFGNLTNLQRLDLSQNKLTGAIPSTFGNLSNLQFLYLNSNKLTGTIPSSLGNLTNLQNLYLNSNKLSGSIPSSLGNLSSVIYMNLGGNQLIDSIPSSFGKLTNLQYLYLYLNQLTGSIPSSLGNLTNIHLIDLYRNKLSGSIPSSLGNLTSLQTLILYTNQLSGSIPASLGNLTNLTTLSIYGNKLTFNGMELIAQKFPTAVYTPQASILLHFSDSTLSVSAGGTLANNTYNWYLNGGLVATKVGDSTYNITTNGRYNVEVTNAIATLLTLYSDTIAIANLPIKAINLQAKATNGEVLLQWQTIDEINTASFTIQHSTDGAIFSDIGTKDAVGSGNNGYSYIDALAASGVNYYRIKSIDKTGSFSYSNVAKLTTNNSQLTTYSLYPNPLKGSTLNVKLGNVTAGKYVVTIYNALGQKVNEQTILHTGGSGSYAFTINNTLAVGIFSVAIRGEGGKQVVYQANLSVLP